MFTKSFKLLLTAAVLAFSVPAMAAEHTGYNWTGPYLGVDAGLSYADTDFQDKDDWFGSHVSNNETDTAFNLGFRGGYNYQKGSLVIGAELGFNWVGNDSTYCVYDTDSCGTDEGYMKSETDWVVTLRAKAGMAIDNTMIYVAAGPAFARTELEVSDFGFEASESETNFGFTVGGGIEHALTNNILVRLDAQFIDLGDTETTSDDFEPFEFGVENSTFTTTVGVSYKF